MCFLPQLKANADPAAIQAGDTFATTVSYVGGSTAVLPG
jgi:hypothetical protein